MISSLLANKLVFDNRDYVTTFQIPGVEGTFAVYPPDILFWVQLLIFFFLQTFLQAAYAAIIYQLVVQKRGTTTAYLVGYGMVLPSVVLIPYYILDACDVQNKTLKLSLGSLPIIVFFRTFEAMYGTSPHTVESSIGTYMTYYSSMAHFEWDPKTKTRKKYTPADLVACLYRLTAHFHLGGLVLSIAMHFNYQPFPSKVKLNEYHFNWDLFAPGHVANCYLLALLTYLILATGFEMSSLGENLKGYITTQVFHNPLYTSRSPTEFWGRKWNILIHQNLKHGVFLPARQFFPIPVCVALTFVASGLLHDYCWTLMFYHHDYLLDEKGECVGDKCYHHIVLKVTAFFAWNSVIMIVEHYFGHYFRFTKNWPTLIVSQLVLLTALPVSHWFTGDWAFGGYFTEMAMGFWTIRKL